MEPLRVYGSEVSYFTGKLEGYLRYKGIAYERIGSAPRGNPGIVDDVAQVPVVALPDGRWMTDTTPIIAWIETILGDRPYLLGDRPTLADFGIFGSMFRHFGMDPTPSTIMRERAPEVYAWVARVWNARASRESGELVSGLPDDWEAILDAIGAAYLPHLCANAKAWKDGRRRFSVEVQGVRYERLRTARYRVWCLEQLRHHFEVLPDATKPRVRSILEKHRCWEPLWRVADTDSGVDCDESAPFGRGHSMTGLGS